MNIPTTPRPACGNCRYFAAGHHRTEVAGECRKHTPRVDRDGRAQWPATKATDWCGEFAPAPRPPERLEPVER